MRTLTKVALVALAVPVGILAYFTPNIRGYYRFKEICEAEGGLRVHQKLKKNVGWMVAAGSSPTWPLHFEHVAFTRSTNSFGKLTDYRYTGGYGPKWSHSETPADLTVPLVYEVVWINDLVPGELQLQRIGYEIRDIATKAILVRWLQFNYSRFDRNRTILNAPSGIVCQPTHQLSDAANSSKIFN